MKMKTPNDISKSLGWSESSIQREADSNAGLIQTQEKSNNITLYVKELEKEQSSKSVGQRNKDPFQSILLHSLSGTLIISESFVKHLSL